MPSAALVFMDVVGYSAESTDIQLDTILDLNREVNYVLYRDFDPLDPKVIAIPTGDGMLLALIDEPSPRPGLAGLCFDLISAVQMWSQRVGHANLRFGLHYGPISYISDINGRKNICGDAANISSRLMSLGGPNHIVASYDFINRFIPEAARKLHNPIAIGRYQVTAIDEVDTSVKHGRRILGYTVVIDHDGIRVGNEESLDIKYHADIRFPAVDKAESRRKTLSRILHSVNKLLLLGLTYQNLDGILHMIGSSIEEVTICIPNETAKLEAADFFGVGLPWSTDDSIMETIHNWSEDNRGVVVNVLQYSEMPQFGATLAFSESWYKGFIHLSMYLMNVLPENTPFMEMVWSNTAQSSPIFSTYHKYIVDLISTYSNINP